MIQAAAAALGGAIGGYGKKPKVPDFIPVNIDQVQTEGIDANVRNMPGAKALASDVNAFGLQELQKALDFLAPGARDKAIENINNMLGGVADVADTQAGIRNATAAGFNLGAGGSQFSKFGVVGHLGRSVAQQRQQGLQSLMGFYSMAPQQFNVASMFFTPQQRLAHATSERNDSFSRELLAEQIKAAPDPMMKAVAEGMIADDQFWGGVVSGMMGSIGGGGGGMGGMPGGGK